MTKSRPMPSRLAAAALVAAALLVAPRPAAAAAPPAPGAPGAPSSFDAARKDCVGTARNTTSKVWFTVAGGVLSDVYEPTVDNTNIRSLEYVVTDGSTFTDRQTRDLTYTVAADPTGMACTVTATSAAHAYRLVTTYTTDPARDAVLVHTRLLGNTRHLKVYAYLDAHVNGNGGGGPDNGGPDTGTVSAEGVGTVGDAATASQATNRDYAVPTFLALNSPQLTAASVGYAGTASDGAGTLDATHALATTYGSAPNGHVVLTEALKGTAFDLALGFGRTAAQAVATSKASLHTPYALSAAVYAAGWLAYDAGLTVPRTAGTGLPAATLLRAYYRSANVIKASEDKTFPGAVVASLASPWGQAVNAGTMPGGRPVFFGSYREVFARDLYETFTGFMADGDVATARATARFLFEKQQLPSGEIPRNSLLNGKVAPDTGGDQLDESAYPILMVYLSGLGGDHALWTAHVKPAADYVVAHGPAFGVERWEEQSGWSPSTIAAEIAGLVAAAKIAVMQGDPASARVYLAVADDFQRTVKGRTVTSNGPWSASPYFIRLSKNGDPSSEFFYGLGNGTQPDVDQRAVIDGGFQELVRLGELSPTDPAYLNSLAVLDHQISVATPTGTGYYRYGTDASTGSYDGYGDCAQPSHSTCTNPGQPWPTTGVGTGHLWPVLSGERAESALLTGDHALAVAQARFMLDSASGVGLVPEQVWESPDLAASPFGTDPTTASIGFADGHAAGSASPLSWAQAQELRLMANLGSGHLVDQPAAVADRYVNHPAPGTLTVTLTAPAPNSTATGSTTTVTGVTAPGAAISIAADDTDVVGPVPTVTTTADGTGAFSADVPVGFGTNVLTVAASSGGATGVARVSVVGDLVGGVTVLDVTDPANDDNGPGTYAYPLSSNFTPGSFDITRFQVLTKDGVVYLRTTLRVLAPTFGNPIGAQMLDVYVHTPDAAPTSTAAAFPARNYSVGSPWSQRVEVQGFAGPVWVDPAGNGKGTVTAVVSSTVTNTITVALPQAQLGTPASGWAFTVVLTGQDGFSPDQARGFTPTPGDFSFGVCAPGGGSPICTVDPGTVPKALDVITPGGVSQAAELDPTAGPVVVAGVPVP